MTETLPGTLSDGLPDDRKRLLYRAMHRGTKEADMVVGRFAQAHLGAMTEEEVAEFARLLEVPDQDLYRWITLDRDVPDNYRTPLLARMQAFDVAATIPR